MADIGPYRPLSEYAKIQHLHSVRGAMNLDTAAMRFILQRTVNMRHNGASNAIQVLSRNET